MKCFRRILVGVLAILSCTSPVAAFCGLDSRTNTGAQLQSSSRFLGRTVTFSPRRSVQAKQPPRARAASSLSMFMGSDGGLLGVGAPEVATILLVGYFVLGPSDLYKVVKEVGKFIQQARTLSTDLTKTVETNLESQLELEEIRKAQRELNDAFSFRRTINVDPEGEEFSAKGKTTEEAEAEGTASIGTAPTKKKKIRRRKKKKPEPVQMEGPVTNDIPDLDMSDLADPKESSEVEFDADKLREERMARLKSEPTENLENPDWLETPDWLKEDMTSTATGGEAEPSSLDQERFAQQLKGDWNESIMANQDKLEPLAKVMERLAILEEEKNAADARLEEEFRLRAQLEEKYYKEARDILEEAAAEVQAEAYVMPKDDKTKA